MPSHAARWFAKPGPKVVGNCECISKIDVKPDHLSDNIVDQICRPPEKEVAA